MIDQRCLLAALNVVKLFTHIKGVEALKPMAMLGAPGIGVPAVFGFTLAAVESPANSVYELLRNLETAAQTLKASQLDISYDPARRRGCFFVRARSQPMVMW
jgi:methylthioribose-1-phosphate isomerase